MTDTASYSNRANTKRAAEKMIADGTAPAIDYSIKPRDDGRLEIKWKTNPAPATDEAEAETTATTETAAGGGREATDGSESAPQAPRAPLAASPPLPLTLRQPLSQLDFLRSKPPMHLSCVRDPG